MGFRGPLRIQSVRPNMFKGERLGSWEGKGGADCALQTAKLTPSAAEPLRTAQSYPPFLALARC